MANVIVELVDAGIRELLKSAEIEEVCEKEAERMTRAAGVNYASDTYVGRTRINASALQKREGNEID